MLGLSHNSTPCSLYFGTPSRQFALEDRQRIIADIVASLRNGVYDLALVYGEDLQGHDIHGARAQPIGPALVLLGFAPDATIAQSLTGMDR
jgi:hypothetical protein